MKRLSRNTSIRLLSVLSIVITALMMTGCGSSTTSLKVTQQNLLLKCPNNLTPLEGLNGKAIMSKVSDWNEEYKRCRIRHNGLVDVVNNSK